MTAFEDVARAACQGLASYKAEHQSHYQAAMQRQREGAMALYEMMRNTQFYIDRSQRARADEACGVVPDDIQ